MSKVKVWNDSDADYKEDFKGREVYIRGHDYVTMPRSEAVTFLGTYTAARRDGVGRNLNQKKIRLEFNPEHEAERKDQPIKFTCEITKKQFRTEEAWDKHLAAMETAKSEEPNVTKNTRGKPASRGKQPIL